MYCRLSCGEGGLNIIQQFIKTLGCNIVIAQIVDDRAVIGNDADVFKVCALEKEL